MERQQELQSEKFQKLLTDIGSKLQPNDVENLKKHQTLQEIPSLNLDDMDSHGRNSGLEFLKKLEEEGFLAENNLGPLKELLQNIERRDLLGKLFEYEIKIKWNEKRSHKSERVRRHVLWQLPDEKDQASKPSSLGKPYDRSIHKELEDSDEEEFGSVPHIEHKYLSWPFLDEEGKEDFISNQSSSKSSGYGSMYGESQFPYGTILESRDFTIDVEGGVHDLSSFGVLLQIQPNAVTRPAEVSCYKLSPDRLWPPTEDDETLVSYFVGFEWSYVFSLQKPIIVTLNHSGPSKKEGYETIVKARGTTGESEWKQIKEIQEVSPLGREHFKSGSIEIEIMDMEWTIFAVVTRLITDTFEVTGKGCVVRSSVCEDVTVEFPEGAVDKNYNGSMKLLLMPDHTDILDGIAAYPCPLLLIDGFERVGFKTPVKIRLPHPYPSGYPSGNVRLLTMDGPHEWKDITDQVYCVGNEAFIEVEVKHFSWLWVWIYEAPLTMASSLSQYLFRVPQEVCFAVFKETELCSDVSLTMTLACVPNHEQFEKIAAMNILGYRRIASSTGNKKMRPDDKAYTKVKGCYKKKLKEDIFLHFIKDDICRKELPLEKKHERNTSDDSDASTELVISFLETKYGDDEDNLCKFCIDETQIVLKQKKTEPSPDPEFQKIETVGLGSAGTSGLYSIEAVSSPSSRTSASKAASCKDLEICFGDKSIAAIDANEAASKVADLLKLDRLSLDDPPDDIVVQCRELCSYLKSNSRHDIVGKLREKLPSGMTGPLGDGSLLVKDMGHSNKVKLSMALAAEDMWKILAENVGVPKHEIKYCDRRVENPVLRILNDHCGNMTVEELYVHIVKSGGNAIADSYCTCEHSDAYQTKRATFI